jgi:zinc/manganese transport system ATP-binding protein
MTRLTITDGTFSYNGTPALTELNLSVVPGEAVALIGPNGSGKSTLLKGVLGLIPLTAGTMTLNTGTQQGDEPGGVGYLPQNEHIDPEFPINLRQVVMMGRYRRLGWWRLPTKADRAAVSAALDAVDLLPEARTRFGTLSGGQQQRGLLARALTANPDLLLLDEPFNGLDQPNRDALLGTIRRLKARGVSIIVTTHDLDLAREVCDSVLLVNGRQVAFGPRDEVLTLANLQEVFHEVQVEVDEHTVVVPGHSH